MKIKIFIDQAFKSQKWDSGDIQTFIHDLEQQHSDTHLSANPMLVQAYQFFVKRQELRMQSASRPVATTRTSDQTPKPECVVCKVTEKTFKHYGSQYYTCDACRIFYKSCLLSSGSPKQHPDCQGSV